MRATTLGALLCLALTQTQAEAASKQVRIAYVEWADAVVATNILKAVKRNRAVAPITPEAHVGYALARHVPPVSRWLAGKLAATAAE